MQVNEQKIFTIPNLISALRVLAAPILVVFIFLNRLDIYRWILLFALVSDILDGLIARVFKMQTRLGAALDSFADLLTYGCAVWGLFAFYFTFLATYWIWFTVVLGLFLVNRLVTFIRYHLLFNSFHSYLAKAMGYIQGGFILSLFFFGFQPLLFYPAMLIGIVSNCEELVILWLLPVDTADIKGLYWVIKKRLQAEKDRV